VRVGGLKNMFQAAVTPKSAYLSLKSLKSISDLI
jgi:hypothetical protein